MHCLNSSCAQAQFAFAVAIVGTIHALPFPIDFPYLIIVRLTVSIVRPK